MTPTTPAIDAVELRKSYPGGRGRPRVRALDGLTFSVPAGRLFAMLGPNGAGKSTATRILTTLSRADGGTAWVAGADVRTDAAAVRDRVGIVPQGTGADGVLSGTENVVMAARMRGASRVDAGRRAAVLLAEFGLDDAAGRAVKSYSGGMRRRLDVAMALVHGPQVLFLDEPTTGLDPESRAALWAEIRRLTEERVMTVVLTTHYLEEADRLADEVMIVDHGVAVVTGTPVELKAALRGDTVQVELLEPDGDAVRRALGAVPGLHGAVIEARGTTGRLTARSDDGPSSIRPLMAALDAAGVAFGAVGSSRPSLDDVYLHHVGRSLTIEDEGSAAA